MAVARDLGVLVGCSLGFELCVVHRLDWWAWALQKREVFYNFSNFILFQ